MSQLIKNYEIIDLYHGKESTHVYFLTESCLYSLNGKSKNGTIYYRCIDNLCNCKGKIKSEVFSRTNTEVSHNHERHMHIAEYERLYFQLKQMVKTDKRPVRDIYDDFLPQLSFEAAGYLNWNKVRHTLLRVRREIMPSCPDLQTFINYFECDEMYEVYGKIRGMPFYLGTVQEDLMVFGNLRMVSELHSSFHLFIDATFGVTPFLTEQLLVVMAEIHHKPRPIAYAIMTSKREIDYTVVLEHIRDSLISYDGTVRVPITAMCDYEKGIRNALVKVWPDLEVNGCLFHLAKALRTNARKMTPLNQIDEGLLALKGSISSKSELKLDFAKFIKYFESTWMKRYKKEDWCVSACPRRTNNNVEGHNRFIKIKIPHNPSPWVFVDGLIDLVYDSLASVAAEKRNFIPTDRSNISDPLKRNLIELQANRIDVLEFLNRMI